MAQIDSSDLQMKFDNLRISDSSRANSYVDFRSMQQNELETKSHILPSTVNLHGSSKQLDKIEGLGKKRTYRELEPLINRKFIGKENRRRSNRAYSSQIPNNNKNIEISTLRFNNNLLQKASAAVDLISQKIEFKNLMN